MRSAGFQEVSKTQERLPLCAWPEGPQTFPSSSLETAHNADALWVDAAAASDVRNRAIGRENKENVQELLYSLALYPLTKLKGFVVPQISEVVLLTGLG